MRNYSEMKEQVYFGNIQLWKNNLVEFTFGNLSLIDRRAGIIAIKPSGVPYEALGINDIVLVDIEGKAIEKHSLKPSSDLPTHIVLYKSFEKMTSVAHTHSLYATIWAQAKLDIPCLGTTHADHLPIGIPCTADMALSQITTNYEYETGLQIEELFENRNISYETIEMVLVASHGPFAWGDGVDNAVKNTSILELLAKMAYLTYTLNPSVSPLSQALIDRHFERKHGKNANYGQPLQQLESA